MFKKITLAGLGLVLFAAPLISSALSLPVSGLYCPNLTVNLQRWSRDSNTSGQVSELQKFLADYFALSRDALVSGYFGTGTENYVRTFQKQYGIPVSGSVGAVTRAKISDVCNGKVIVVTAPNGGEQWKEGVLNTVTWKPYQYNPDLNPARDVTAYLETKNSNGTYTTLGKVEESGKASIHWITGELNSSTQGGILAPAGGGYYIRVVNNVTGAWDRSDAPFTLQPKPTDLKVNGSDGPLTLNAGDAIQVSWKSQPGVSSCQLSGLVGVDYSTIQPSSGSLTGNISSYFGNTTVSINCVYGGATISDYVSILMGPQNPVLLQVMNPNGGEQIPYSQPYVLRWHQVGLGAVSLALYKNDQWQGWINKSVILDKTSDDNYSYMWNPSEASYPNGTSVTWGSNDFKIYITGQRADGQGYVDDKSDAPFSFVATSTVPVATGSLSVSTDASSPSYAVAAAGTTGVTLGAYKLRATGESIAINKLNTFLSTDNGGSGNPGNIQQIYAYSGSTLLGSGVFLGLGQNSTITLSNPLKVPRDTDSVITIKADLARIGAAQPGVSGDLIKLQLASAEGVGMSSGSNIGGNNGEQFGKGASAGVAGVRIFRTYPTVALDTLPGDGLPDGRLIRFKITANPANYLSIGALNFSVNTVIASVSNIALYAYSDSAYSTPVSGQGAGGLVGTPTATGSKFGIIAGAPLAIPAGQTVYFELRGTVAGAGIGSVAVTTLLGDSAYTGTGPFASQKEKGSFTWSPNSNTFSQFTDSDWTNGFGIPGLSPNGLIQSRSTAGGVTTCPPGTLLVGGVCVMAPTSPVTPPTVIPPTCSITSDKPSYMYGDTITFNWTSTGATYANWVPDTSGKDNFVMGADKLAVSGSATIMASVTGSPYVTMTVVGNGGTGTCSRMVLVGAPPPPPPTLPPFFLVSDASWKQVDKAPASTTWMTVGFDDSAWKSAVDEGSSGISPWTGTWISMMPSGTAAHWIWSYNSRASADTKTLYFRKTFVPVAYTANIAISADNSYIAYLNGVQIGASPTQNINVALNQGVPNVLAIQVKNTGGPGGLLVDLRSTSAFGMTSANKNLANALAALEAALKSILVLLGQ